jgi:hypothetical protein
LKLEKLFSLSKSGYEPKDWKTVKEIRIADNVDKKSELVFLR